MSKPKPPSLANDHLAATPADNDLSMLTDAELDARLKAADAAYHRATKENELRITEAMVARLNAELARP
jgi:hypothetical protein